MWCLETLISRICGLLSVAVELCQPDTTMTPVAIQISDSTTFCLDAPKRIYAAGSMSVTELLTNIRLSDAHRETMPDL